MIPSVNFDRILQAGQRVFGQPITVNPQASQPGVAPYPARGIFSSRAVDLQEAEGGGMMVAQVITLGIRLADFVVPPVQKDAIILGDGTIPGAYIYAVSDPPRLDGQGGADLTLKIVGAVT